MSVGCGASGKWGRVWFVRVWPQGLLELVQGMYVGLGCFYFHVGSGMVPGMVGSAFAWVRFSVGCGLVMCGVWVGYVRDVV